MTLDQVATIEQGIIEHISTSGGGWCEVPSVSRPGLIHRVYFNDKLYSQSCDCEAGQHNQDCGHALAVDRHFDSRRAILKRDRDAEGERVCDDPFIQHSGNVVEHDKDAERTAYLNYLLQIGA